MQNEILNYIKTVLSEYIKEYAHKLAEREIATSKMWLAFGVIMILMAVIATCFVCVGLKKGFSDVDWLPLCVVLILAVLAIGMCIVATQVDDIYTAMYTPEITFWRQLKNEIISSLQ